MVLSLFVDCHTRSGRDKDVSFFRVPSIDTNRGEEAEERSIERRTQWIAAISRDDLTEQILKNDRVCSRFSSWVSQQKTLIGSMLTGCQC